MRCAGRKFLVAATVVLLAVAGSCSSEGDRPVSPVDPSRRPGNAADGYPFERAFVACLQDHGSDAELLPDGVVSFGSKTILSRDESNALRDLCDQRLEDEGFVREEPSDEMTERTYNAWVDFRECMVDQGIALGELVSFESFAANSGSVGDLLVAAVREDLAAFKEAYKKCPSRIGFATINSEPAESTW